MKKILVIEDNLEVRENICELLELSGYTIFSAENGKDGAKKAIEILPDLIICDVMMPVLDGYGTLKVLHNNPKTTHIPFIFLTAKADRGDFRKGMNLGADDYITKPFDDLELIEAIETRLEKNKQKMTQGNVFNVEAHYQKTLTEFVKNKEVRFYNKKDVIFKENTSPRYIFWLKKGKAQTFKTNDWGKELVLSFYGDNDLIGVEDAFREGYYKETSICIEDAEIALIPKEELLDWVRSDMSIAQHFIKFLAKETSEKDKDLLGLAYSSVRERVVAALLKLQQHYHTDKSRNFEINILREDLAHIVGTAKETVTRMLSDLKTEKLIEIKGSKLTILDIEGLAEIVGE